MNSWQQPVSGEPSVGTLHLFPLSSSSSYYTSWNIASNQRSTFDFSSLLPAGTKAVQISAFVNFRNTTAAQVYAQVRAHFSDDNTITPTYNTYNTLVLDGVGALTAATTSFAGGTVSGPVRVDNDRKFYGYRETLANCNSAIIYLKIIGYYI